MYFTNVIAPSVLRRAVREIDVEKLAMCESLFFRTWRRPNTTKQVLTQCNRLVFMQKVGYVCSQGF